MLPSGFGSKSRPNTGQRLPLLGYSVGIDLHQSVDGFTPVAWVEVQRLPKQNAYVLKLSHNGQGKPVHQFRLDRDCDGIKVAFS